MVAQFEPLMHLSIFPREGGGGRDTLGIRQQNQDSWDGKLDTFSRSSKLNHTEWLLQRFYVKIAAAS